MPRPLALLLGLSLAVASAGAEVVVQPKPSGRIDLSARAAPLSEVLDRLARQTGMKIEYEGAAPRQMVTITLVDRLPSEAVIAILEGQGVNFALVGDQSGTRVRTLMIAGTAPASSARPVAAPLPRPAFQASLPDTAEALDDAEELPQEPPTSDPAMRRPSTPPRNPGDPPMPPGTPGGPPRPGGPVPAIPQQAMPSFPASPSPFATSPVSPSPVSPSPVSPSPFAPSPFSPSPFGPQPQSAQPPQPGPQTQAPPPP